MDHPNQPPKLRDRVRQAIRTRHYSRRTEKSYRYWIRYFFRFHGMRHPSELGEKEVRDFLTWLAVEVMYFHCQRRPGRIGWLGRNGVA